MGESRKFGYSVMVAGPGGIGTLLEKAIQDPKIVAIVYNWETQTAFTKSGFRLSDPTDSALNSKFTTFLVKSRINSPPQTPIPSASPKPALSGFVRFDSGKNQFAINDAKFVPVGFNAYWLGLTEEYTYPDRSQVTQMFQIAQKMAATLIRSLTLGVSCGSPNSLRPNDNLPLNVHAWPAIDFAFAEARKYGIKLICPLLDAYSYFHGSYGDFCPPGVDKSNFFTNQDARAAFKSYVSQWMNHVNSITGIAIKDDPTLMCIELGNELGIYRPDAGSIAVPTREWITDVSAYIKTIDRNHLVLNGSDECLGSDTSRDFEASATVDVYFYSVDTNRILSGADNSARVARPYVIGEYAPDLADPFFKIVEGNSKIHGSVFWGMYPNQNGSFSGQPVIHSDGFTLNWIPSDMSKLLMLSNHMRRMQQTPEVSAL
ncbi:glycoside hydrolase superfamily [Chytriomyces cf. hyalinus JEL632]|nr:glycoside hydrolase superfamily [Chytriomyces cf. hyalinus JEL632]